MGSEMIKNKSLYFIIIRFDSIRFKTNVLCLSEVKKSTKTNIEIEKEKLRSNKLEFKHDFKNNNYFSY